MIDPRGAGRVTDPTRILLRQTLDRSGWAFSTAGSPDDPVGRAGGTTRAVVIGGPPPDRDPAVTATTPWGPARTVSVELAPALGPTLFRARRRWTVVAPHVVVVVDEIAAAEPLWLGTHFVTEDPDGSLAVNAATPSRVVLRRGGEAVKLLGMSARVDDTDQRPDVRSTPSAGTDGVVHTFVTGPGRTHRTSYVLIADDEPRIRGWHADLEPDGRGVLIADAEGGAVVLPISPADTGDTPG